MKKVINSISLLIFPLYALILVPFLHETLFNDIQSPYYQSRLIVWCLLYLILAVWLVISVYANAVKQEKANKITIAIGIAEPAIILVQLFTRIIPINLISAVAVPIETELSYVLPTGLIILGYYILLLILNIKSSRPKTNTV